MPEDKSVKASDILGRSVEARKAAARLFRTADGKLVYDYIMRQYYHSQFNDVMADQVMRAVGRRDVALAIRAMAKLEDEDA